MKIVLLVTRFLPRWTAGTEIATFNIAKHLINRGHDVHIVTSFDDGTEDYDKMNNINIHRVKWPNIRLIGTVIFWFNITICINKIRPEIVSSQSIGLGIPALITKIVLNIPYVVWGRGSDVYLNWRFKSCICNLALRNADLVLALTEDMKKNLPNYCIKKTKVVYNGIDLERFNIDKQQCREANCINGNEGTIIFIGRLNPIKGVKYLIIAMKLFLEKNENAKLLIIGGDDGEKNYLEDLAKKLNISNSIIFAGKISNDLIPNYLYYSDIFILPSLSEGFPNTILEAMASGLPIIASNVGGINEIVQDGINGYLVEPGKPDQIYEKIHSLFENEELRNIMKVNNKMKAMKYSWESIAYQLENCYRKIIY